MGAIKGDARSLDYSSDELESKFLNGGLYRGLL